MKIDVEIRKIEASKTAEGIDESSAIFYTVNSSLNEVKKEPEKLILNFLLDVETQPAAAKITIIGIVMITGNEEELTPETLGATDSEGVPVLFMKIYQKVYPIMYLLANTLHLPYPSPGLIKLTNIEKEEPTAQQ